MMHFKIPRWLKWTAASAVFLYFSVCAIIGNSLITIAVHPQRTHLPSQAWRGVAIKAGRVGGKLSNVSITTRDGVTLRGWYVQPANWNGKTAIVLHGVGDTRQSASEYGMFLMQHGFAFLAPDLRAHGESGGEVFGYGALEAEDVHEWANWLYAAHKPSCLYGLGESIGAAIILQSLKYEPRYCAVMAEASFSDMRDIANERLEGILFAKPWMVSTFLRP